MTVPRMLGYDLYQIIEMLRDTVSILERENLNHRDNWRSTGDNLGIKATGDQVPAAILAGVSRLQADNDELKGRLAAAVDLYNQVKLECNDLHKKQASLYKEFWALKERVA